VRDAAVLIPAGGVGTRLGRRTPKQFLRLGGPPLLLSAVRPFLGHPAVHAVVVAVPEPYVVRARRLLAPAGRAVSVTVVPGGPSRQESVGRALQAAPAGSWWFTMGRARS
jgi:2-C-methyl-D-erythritol 4-phosphate cytidylyltransferase